MQMQHEQVMRNLRSSQLVEIRRALHNQSVDLSRQHHTEAEWHARGEMVIARDRAVLELQELQEAHSSLQAEVLRPRLNPYKRMLVHSFDLCQMRRRQGECVISCTVSPASSPALTMLKPLLIQQLKCAISHCAIGLACSLPADM